MRTEDCKKLIKAGFTILRPIDYPKPKILMFARGRWQCRGEYASKEKRDAALNKQLLCNRTILD